MYENYTVLFVDDEVNILNALKRGLIDEEYKCLFAESGEKALDIMENNIISVVVSDMRMPKMDGLTLLKTVKSKWPLTVGIVLSGYTQLQQILTTINQVDIFKFITKPWKLEEEFKSVIIKALDYYILHEENEKYKEILQKKNITYQNILKRIDEVVNKAKYNTQIMGILGRKIIEHTKSMNCTNRNRYEFILSSYEKIYLIFEELLITEDKEISISSLTEEVISKLDKKCDFSFVNSNLESGLPYKISVNLMEAVLKSCIVILNKEFIADKVYIKEEHSKDTIILNFILPNSLVAKTTLDERIDFLNFVLSSVLKFKNINFGIVIFNKKIIIEIKIDVSNSQL